MDSVDNIERVNAAGVHVRSRCRRGRKVGREVEDVARGRLAGGRGLRGLESDGIVAGGVSRVGCAIAVPAVRGDRQVLRVGQQLEALGRSLFRDG